MRGAARELLGNPTEAEADYVAAVESDRTDQEAAIRYATFLCRQDRPTEALAAIRPAVGAKVVLELALMFANLPLELGTAADKRAAVACLRRGIGEPSGCSPFRRGEAFRLLSLLTGELESVAAALAVAGEFSAEVVPEAARGIVEASLCLQAGDAASAREPAGRALLALTADSPLPLRIQVAGPMEQLRRYSDVLTALRPVTSPERFEIIDRQAIAAAHRSGTDDFIVEYGRSLREGGRWDTAAVEMEVETLRRYGDYGSAVAICQEFIRRSPDDKDRRFTRLRLSLIGLQWGKPELIERDPERLPRIDEVTPATGQLLCSVLTHGEVPHRAVEVAYELVRRHYGSEEAHSALCAAVGIGRPEWVTTPEPSLVEPGAAVQIRMDGEPAPRWLVLEDGPNPDRTRSEYPPDHRVSQELLGKRKGDRFADRANPYQERHGEVVAVSSKYEFRAWDSISRWPDFFPAKPFAIMFDLKSVEGDRPDFGPILRAFEARDQDEESLRGWCRDNPVSLHMLSVASHRHPSQLVPYLTSHPDMPVRCFMGTSEECEAGA